jgi:ankyrin repeat protein
MVWYGMVWYGMVWYGMVWYGTEMENRFTPFPFRPLLRNFFNSLHYIIGRVRITVKSTYISIPGCDINCKNWIGNTPLCIAASHGNTRLIKYLLRKGILDRKLV